MKKVEAGVIGVGWIGGLRADTLSRTALVDKLHLCDIKPDRLAEVKKLYKPATATLDYNDLIKNDNIRVVYVSTTPEANHYPIARDCLKSGKNVMLEKPIALELWEADELHPAGEAQRSEIHHRLFAALQSESGLRQEEDHRRHARQCGFGAGQPPSVARARQEDREPRAAVAGRHGIDPRSRFRVLAA